MAQAICLHDRDTIATWLRRDGSESGLKTAQSGPSHEGEGADLFAGQRDPPLLVMATDALWPDLCFAGGPR